MSGSTQIYILDTSVLIQAHRVYYSFDIAPAFWNFLIDSAKTGEVVSIDRVFDEIIECLMKFQKVKTSLQIGLKTNFRLPSQKHNMTQTF